MNRPARVRRHSLIVRLSHWLAVPVIAILMGTGFNIFNAHPFLYWGAKGSSTDTADRWLAIGAVPDGEGGRRGLVVIGTSSFETTGLLGVSSNAKGRPVEQAYPGWATLPAWRDLGLARNWHFAAAWGLALIGFVYLGHGLATGHIIGGLVPRRSDLAPRNLMKDVRGHLRLAKGRVELRYKPLQKLAYTGVILLILPLLMLSGLGMSPGMDAAWPWIVDLFGGRQSARSVHWLMAQALLLFVAVHLLMLLLAGPWRLLKPMLTGWQATGRTP